MVGSFCRYAVFVVSAALLSACQSPSAIAPDMREGAAAISVLPMHDVDLVPASTMMPSVGFAAPPSGFVAFCDRDPGQCKSMPNKTAPIALTAKAWQTLNDIDKIWNAAIKPEEDAAHYGQVDYWTIPTDGYGDCEDYALAKRQALIADGFAASDLRLAVARTQDGTAHTVLTVSTDKGDYVLDNLSAAVRPWSATGYEWIARQDAADTRWAFVGFAQPGEARIASAEIKP